VPDGLLRRRAARSRCSISIRSRSDQSQAAGRVVPEDLALFDRLTGAETLSFVGQVHGIDRVEARERSKELLALWISPGRQRSGGRLFARHAQEDRAVGRALPAPRLLFLDEPFEGIDAIASRQIKDLLSAYVRGGGTVFLTTHILEIVERLCNHIGIIHKGGWSRRDRWRSCARAAPTGQSLEEAIHGHRRRVEVVDAGDRLAGRMIAQPSRPRAPDLAAVAPAQETA
jgi:ABC-type multidrug transport system ATPase subunit